MPTWFPDRRICFQKDDNDASVTDDEDGTIVKWVDAGAPRGDPSDMPKLPEQEDISTWRIGKPDLIVQYPAYRMPATGPDLYGTLTAPFGTKEDRYIKAMQSRVIDANSRMVVHHALSFPVPPDDNGDMGADTD